MTNDLCIPKEGQLLYRGCSYDDFAKILRVGEDPNEEPVIDIELIESINELYFPRFHEETDDNDAFNLAEIVLPENTPVKIINVQYRPVSRNTIELAISAGGCYRCTTLFYPHNAGEKVVWDY